MNEAPTVLEIDSLDRKLNVPQESFDELKSEPKSNWNPFKKAEKTDKNTIVHEIVNTK